MHPVLRQWVASQFEPTMFREPRKSTVLADPDCKLRHYPAAAQFDLSTHGKPITKGGRF